jgi:hypothetical protein
MKIHLKKTMYGFVPMYPSDKEYFDKLEMGWEGQVDITKPRNLGFHKKYFALLNLGFQNTKTGIAEFEHYRYWAIMKAGYYAEPMPGMYVPRSISFAKMDEDEFEKLYQNTIQVIIADTGADYEDIENNLIDFF